VVGEAANGLEAVRAAEELHPDLILLDIGLPIIDGIEAARRIRGVSPHSRILYISAGHSRDMAEEVLRTGADGYLIKSETAQGELLGAVRTVLRGQRYVSASLKLQDPAGSPVEGVAEDAEAPQPVASILL